MRQPRDLTNGRATSSTLIAIAVISLGQRLKLNVIAEAAETQTQRDFLRANHCHESHGLSLQQAGSPPDIEVMLLDAKHIAA